MENTPMTSQFPFRHDGECCGDAEKPRENGIAARLLQSRIVMVAGEIEPETAEGVLAQLLLLDTLSNDPIRVVVSSPGGHVDSGYAIHDMMRFVKSPVLALGAGWVASIAVPILLGADRGKRFSLPNTRFLLHQPSGGAGGQAADIRIEAQEILKIRQKINKLITGETGQPEEKVAKDSDRNFWMSAEEALEYGLISGIVSSMADVQ